MVRSVDIDSIREELLSHLPLTRRWRVRDTTLDWDFSLLQKHLLPISPSNLNQDHIPDEWRQVLLFGICNHSTGGGAVPFYGISATTGEIFALDLERDYGSELNFINSSAQNFINTYLVFDQSLHDFPQSTGGLTDRARATDPDCFDRSEWKSLAEYAEYPTDRA